MGPDNYDDIGSHCERFVLLMGRSGRFVQVLTIGGVRACEFGWLRSLLGLKISWW